MDDSDDPVIWWRKNKSKYDVLTTIANKYFSSPSSVESERVFSAGGNIYTPHRNRLKPEMREILMFIHFNLKVFQFNF